MTTLASFHSIYRLAPGSYTEDYIMAKKQKSKKKMAKKTVAKKKASKKGAGKTKKTTTKKKITKKKATSKKATKVSKKASKKVTKKKVSKKAVKKTPPAPKVKLSPGLKIGDSVPHVDIPATDGTFNVSKFLGKNIVLYFYPKDDTPGCTLEGHDFSNNIEKFAAENTVIYGVSKDSLKSHNSFCLKYGYKHPLMSDETEKLCQIFGVIKEKNMYGRKYQGIERSTFLIDKKGTLAEIWRGVKVEGHVDAVLARVKELNTSR